MNRFLLILTLAFVWGASTRAAQTDFSVTTTKGYVSYTVKADWTVVGTHTELPVTSTAFQIPNPVEKGKVDSTKLTVMTFDSEERDSSAFFRKFSQKIRSQAKRAKYKSWEIYSQERKQGTAAYSLLNACRQFPGAYVMVSVVWPRLPENPKDYDARMEAACHFVLDSVSGGLGRNPKNRGEVSRKPSDEKEDRR